MKSPMKARGAFGIMVYVAFSAACSSSNTATSTDGGSALNSSDAGTHGSDAGSSSTCVSSPAINACYVPPADPINDGNGHTLRTFTPPGDTGPNTFIFTISGEVNAVVGYAYPPYNPEFATIMVDGWSWKIEKYIVVVDHITLWNDPNVSSSDQSQHGSIVAQINGPFVVDLHKGGPIPGAGGGGEQSLAIAALTNMNQAGGASFGQSTMYAFGFSTVQAPSDGSAINVNLDSSEEADYQYMVAHGASVYYYGTAEWAGDQTGVQNYGLCSSNSVTNYCEGWQTCAATNSSVSGEDASVSGGDASVSGGDASVSGGDASVSGEDASAEGDGGSCPGTCDVYDFGQLPQQMTFQFAFPTPTNYVNCVNYTLSEQAGMDVRGVQTSPTDGQIEQVTVHMDHPFWESFQEDTPVHWDQIAAQYIGVAGPDGGPPVAHLEDFVNVPFNPFTDHNGVVVPWRWCEDGTYGYTPPSMGPMSFSTLSVPVDPTAPCTGAIGVDFTSPMDNCKDIRDYYDFIRYTQSTQGHLNSQGLCYIDRQYPAPGGGS
jgi:hypothetical protein